MKASGSGLGIDQPVNEGPAVRKSPEKTGKTEKIEKKKLPNHPIGGLKPKKRNLKLSRHQSSC
ncbi:TPA: hypothetical protein HA338_01790 [Methanosarcina acetivorans]|uniref:Uncharacterized protein n=1 Tax=Methanosarcina acetivorans TaxID=2214 RepID=A0A832W763_9EURY|nr:hypothetical protein [Methanosarcina acetivorans]HIH92808.1 hypothetical protein [Methanosarcina acetivorans]